MASGPEVMTGRVDVSRVREALAALNADAQKRIIYSAASLGAKVIQVAAKRIAETIPSGDAPGLVDSHALVNNIARVRRPRSGSRFIYHIGVRAGSGKQVKENNNPWYWRLLELGYKRGRSFVRYPNNVPAFEDNKERAAQEVAKVIVRRVVREQAKFNKGNK
jgi:hypothetical protein